jgi:hypothetical protein
MTPVQRDAKKEYARKRLATMTAEQRGARRKYNREYGRKRRRKRRDKRAWRRPEIVQEASRFSAAVTTSEQVGHSQHKARKSSTASEAGTAAGVVT